MDIVLIEIILWAGLLFFFWSLKDNLGKIEEIIDEPAGQRRPDPVVARTGSSFSQAEQLLEPLASYLDQTIYRFALSGGRRYEFDSILADGKTPTQRRDDNSQPRRLMLAPGLLYLECRTGE